MNTRKVHSLREWAPMSEVIEKIPIRVNKGLFPADLSLTCIDAVAEFLVLGSDAGIVFWYNRNRGDVQKLYLETSGRITCVKAVNSVEYMLAAGNASGQVNVFQIQKDLPKDLNLVAPCARVKPIQRYIIRDLHHSTITCCEWSKNGMQLYSGDRQGVVVATEFDYQNHLSKSAEILSEAYEIVQLNVHQRHLLVSTLYRSIICQRGDTPFGNWKITQVGKKDRKQLFDCGGIFIKEKISREPKVLCCRPGLRFWLSDITGFVEKTLIFKEAVSRSATWEIPILNPKASQKFPSSNGKQCEDLKNFGRLHLYDCLDTLVVTHDDDAKLYILNLTHLRVEAVAIGFRKIMDMCVCGNEIFILEGDRSLIRLAPLPEKPNKRGNEPQIIFNPSMPPPVPPLSSITSSSICESPSEYRLGKESAVTNAEECLELPPIEEINFNIPVELAVESPRSEQSRRLEIFQQISDLDFDHTILHHSDISSSVRSKRSKSKSRDNIKSQGIVEIGRSAIREVVAQPETLDITTNHPVSMEADFSNETIRPSNGIRNDNQPTDILTPVTLQQTMEIETKQLSEERNIPALHVEPITADKLSSLQILAAAAHKSNNRHTEQHRQLPLIYPEQHSFQLEDAGVQSTACKPISLLPDECDVDSIDAICKTAAHKSNNCHTEQHWQLPLIYPEQHSFQLEDAGVQSTACKPISLLPDECDVESIDAICKTLCSGNLEADKSDEASAGLSKTEQSKVVAKFLPSKPVDEEFSSFELDFSRACDPKSTSPPISANSHSSTEWEFL